MKNYISKKTKTGECDQAPGTERKVLKAVGGDGRPLGDDFNDRIPEDTLCYSSNSHTHRASPIIPQLLPGVCAKATQ